MQSNIITRWQNVKNNLKNVCEDIYKIFKNISVELKVTTGQEVNSYIFTFEGWEFKWGIRSYIPYIPFQQTETHYEHLISFYEKVLNELNKIDYLTIEYYCLRQLSKE